MKTDLSAFLDDELEAHQHQAVLTALATDEALRRAWDGYHLIGDVLRRTPCLENDLTVCVMSSLHNEPVVLAPQTARPRNFLRVSMALAATVAGVAVVAWLAMGPVQPATTVVALARPVKQVVKSPDSNRMQEYLVAHQAFSPSDGIQGGTVYVRSVSMTSDSAAQ